MYAARHATRYGEVVAFMGGFLGDLLYLDNYAGEFASTPGMGHSRHPQELALANESIFDK